LVAMQHINYYKVIGNWKILHCHEHDHYENVIQL
jgi:hypothetical protein